MKKRLLSTFLCLCMALTLLPAPAGAASAAVTDADGLKAAIAAGGTVTLGGDFTVSESLTVNKSVTLDLNGHTVTAAQGLSTLFQLEEGASFILQDSGADGALRAAEPDPEEMEPLTTDLVYMKGGEFWLQGGTLDATAGDAVITHYDATGASFLMTGGALAGDAGLYLRGRGNLAVVTGGSIRGSNHALYVDGVSYVYLGGDVTTDGSLHNTDGALTVTGGTHSGVLYTGSSYQSPNVTTLICGGDFHGVWQSKYGEFMLYGGSFALDPDGTYSFKTNQTDKTLADYVGEGATLEPNTADGAAPFSVTGPEGYALQIVGVFGAAHGTAEAVGVTLDNTNRLIIDDGAEITATADVGYVSHVDTSKDGVILVTFLPETPVATLSWTEGGESQSAQLTEREVRYGLTGDYLRDADQAAGASMTFLADTAAGLGFEGISPVTLTSDENGPYTLSRDMADDGHSKTGEMLSVGDGTSVTVTNLTLDGTVPPAPPFNTQTPAFVKVDGSLTLGNGATVQNGQSVGNGSNKNRLRPALPPAAVDVRGGGDLTLASGSKVINNQGLKGGVLKNYNGTVSLSGDVTVKGNQAVDLTGISSFDQLVNAPRTTANLVVYQTQQKAAGAPIQVTGALTGGEKSIGLTLLHTEMDPKPTTGKIVAGTASYPLQDSDLAAFFSDRPGYFLALNSEENAIYLDEYAITAQPTADTPTVVVNQTKDAAYQWYPVSMVATAITGENVSQEHPKGTCDADGKWTAGSSFGSPVYFTLPLKAGDRVVVTQPTANVVGDGQLYLADNETNVQLWYAFDGSFADEGVTASQDGDNTVVTYVIPEDGTYALCPGGTDCATVISVALTKVTLGDAVISQTSATLAAPTAGTYLCRVTWPDGTVLDSDVISVAAAPHKHAVSVDCETDSGEQVTFLPLTSQDGALYIDGKAAEADSYYVLPAGHYYLAEDVRLDQNIYAYTSTSNSVLDLCLNGYKLEYAGGGDKNVISVGRLDQAFNICDCNPTGQDRTGNVINNPISGYTEVIWGGVITGGTRAAINHPGSAPVTLYGGTIAGNGAGTGTVYGGGVNARNFVMRGGAIKHNKATYGGGVAVGASFTMTEGTISGNWAATGSGGVHTFERNGVPASVTLSGDVKITGNVMGTLKTTPSNLNLVDGSIVTVAPEGLGENAGVGVTTATAPTDASPVTVAVAGEGDALTADDLAKFSSDNSDYELKLSEGSIVLATPEPYAITTQPTVANGYTVTASYPEKAHYQWYRSDDGADIGRKIALEGAAFGSAAEGANYDGGNGHWTGRVKNGVCEFFTLNLKAGQLVYLGIDGTCVGKPFTLTGDNGKTVTVTPTVRYLYLPVPADGRYTLRVSGLTGSYVTLFNADLYPPLAGQTGAALVPAKGGSHFCLVTWDGTEQYERSNYVTPVIATTSLALEPETLALQVGQTEYLEVTRTPEDANDDVTWASDNEGVATVNNSGRVEAVSVGTATVTATANGITASCTVTVTPVPAITQQPTPDNGYTVGVNYAPEGIFYQWYPASTSQKTVGTEDSETSVKAEPAEDESGNAATFADETWTYVEVTGGLGAYFSLDLKQEDILTLVMDTADVPDGGVMALLGSTSTEQWYYFDGSEEPAEGVSVTTRGEDTLLTYIIPADGQYGLCMAYRSYDPEDDTEQYYTPPTLSATLTRTELGEAVSGQTTAKLTAEAEGSYLCRVTWPDGTALNSDVVAYVPLDPGESKGEVEVKGDTPPVTVDKDALKDLAGEVSDGDTVTVKLTVEKQDSPADKDDIQAVVTGKKDDVLYLDLSLLKQVNDDAPEAITNTGDTVLEIAVDYDFTGKKDVTVYRKHGDDPAAALDKLTEKPTEAFTDGSFFADSANGKVYIYASKFSTYAIGYTAQTTTPVTPGRPHYSSAATSTWPFTDVKTTDEFYRYIKYVYEKKWMEGTSATTFDPNGTLTRAMLATVLYRAAGSPKVEGAPEFEDVPADAWYANAVTWANQTTVLRGYGNRKFGPDDPVSREMLNTVMARLKGEDPAWTGDPALAVPATRAEIAQGLMQYGQNQK